MKNFDESLLSENGINVLDYLSDGGHQEQFLEEVDRFGDEELSKAYKKLFEGDAKIIAKENDLQQLFKSNNQVKLVKECITQNKLCWLIKLLKKRDVDWFAEKMAAETGNFKVIECLITRRNLGWATQNVVVEFNHPEWTEKIIKKQSDISPYAKAYIIANYGDDIVIKLIKHAFLSFEEQEMIVNQKRYSTIKALVLKYKDNLAKTTLLKIVELGDLKLIKLISKLCSSNDDVKAHIIKVSGSKEIAREFLLSKKLGKLTQKAIVGLQNAELIRQMVKNQIHPIPLNICIAETLNFSLIKEFIGDYKNLSKKEKKYIYSSGNSEMIRLINTLI